MRVSRGRSRASGRAWGGHGFFHGEAQAPPLETNVVIAAGNCGLYAGPWGVRVEDTVVVRPEGPRVLTGHPYRLATVA